jgi:cytochrome b561
VEESNYNCNDYHNCQQYFVWLCLQGCDILMSDEEITFSIEEKEEMEKDLTKISDYQRLSSILVWIGLTMVVLHIAADIFFHVIN